MRIEDKIFDGSIELIHLNADNISSHYVDWLNDSDLMQFTETRRKKYNSQNVVDFINQCNVSDHCLLFGIFLDERHIGNIKADLNFHHKTASIGLIIGERSMHGQGIGSKAIKLLSSYLLNSLKIFKINAGTYASNIASLKTFEKSGYSQEYIKKQHVINIHGTREDVIMMVRYAN